MWPTHDGSLPRIRACGEEHLLAVRVRALNRVLEAGERQGSARVLWAVEVSAVKEELLSSEWANVEWLRRLVLHDEPQPDGDGFRPAGSVVLGLKATNARGEKWGQVALVFPPITEQGVEYAWAALVTSMNDLLK